jgi:Ca2+-binding RTX toxin-like protein
VRSSISFSLGDGTHVKGAVENLTLTGTASINATGSSIANTLTGNDGDNVLNGGAGGDTMIGGNGNDTYVVDSTGDKVIETGSGHDKVLSYQTFSLTAAGSTEDLTLLGSKAINGTGNGLANAITGNAAANILSGGDGNDTLIGGGGTDTLTGGNGADQFRFTGLGALDTVKDFHSGQDSLVFDAAGFGGGLSAGHAPVVDLTSNVKAFVASGLGGHFIYEHNASTYGTLYWDANGGSGSDAVAVAKLMNVASLSALDFHIV